MDKKFKKKKFYNKSQIWKWNLQNKIYEKKNMNDIFKKVNFPFKIRNKMGDES